MSEEPLDPFLVWLLGRAGLSADAYRPSSLQRRLHACLRLLHCDSGEQARALIEQRPQLLGTAISTVLLGVTEFYRDPSVFDALRELLPGLLPPDRPLRVWSASCSDGCELYTVGALLAEQNILHRSELLGTDCRPDALERARVATFTSQQFKNLPADLRELCFEPEGARFRAVEGLRHAALFRENDLLKTTEPGPWDVILWRNTAIYLKLSCARQVWGNLAESLAPHGLLVTGKAERPECDVPLKRLLGCIYMKS